MAPESIANSGDDQGMRGERVLDFTPFTLEYEATDTDKLGERFVEKVELADNGCWFWTGMLDRGGYGRIKVGPRAALAHRTSYELFVGPIPEGLHIDHLCRERSCVNFAHLEVVDNKTNVLRGVGWGAQNAKKTHCPQGHPYDEVNTIFTVTGRRLCLTCQRAHKRAYEARKRSMKRGVR